MILDSFKGKKIIIYGTGHVARKFYKAMEKHGLREQVQCFVRSRDIRQGESFEGVPVYSLEAVSVEEDTLICLAVHESLRDEIEKTVAQVTGQYLWIYPYLYELLLGEPEQEAVELPVGMLLRGYQNDLRMGVRLASIEQEDGLNKYGFDYYIRAQMLHCDRETAEQRLKQFSGLIAEWKRVGYQKKYLLTLNRDYGVIDGNHRLAMAVYTGQKTIYGNIHPTDLALEDIHGCEAMLGKELLAEHGFSGDELVRLERIQRRYMRAYGNE